MKISTSPISKTKIQLIVSLDDQDLGKYKQAALTALSKDQKIPGFRKGKAPASLVEKNVDPQSLADEVIQAAVNGSYFEAIQKDELQPTSPPEIEVTKFVPYTDLEFKATVEQIVIEKIADYKKISVSQTSVEVPSSEVERVLENMRLQLATRKDITSAAKDGDQVWIDFSGVDEKGAEVKGAKGTNYPLMLGSNTFIPGFEANLIGMKKSEEKKFNLKFPNDYGLKALQSKKVEFRVKVVNVQSITRPQIDEEFVAKVAPQLKTVTELKKDIMQQLKIEAELTAQKQYENSLVAELVAQSEVLIPEALVLEQSEKVMQELKQNILYRGQTFNDYLEAIGMTEAEQREKEIVPEAKRRLKAGVLLGEIADKEKLTVSPVEIDQRIAELKQRYPSDQQMQNHLQDPRSRSEIGSMILTEKTVAKIVELQKN